MESKLPNPAAEADFHVEPVLVRCWVTLGPPLVDAGGPRPGKADPMLPTDGHSALPVSPRLLLMSQGEGFFLVNIWFVTVRIYTLYSSPHTHFISLDFDLACKEAMCKLPQASKKRVFMRC